eukprot:4279569-Alexandrium_andersonii.AAC.1
MPRPKAPEASAIRRHAAFLAQGWRAPFAALEGGVETTSSSNGMASMQIALQRSHPASGGIYNVFGRPLTDED